MGYGDEILAAGQAQRHFETYGQRCVIVDRYGRVRWHEIWENNPVIGRPEEAESPHFYFHRILNAPNARPYIVYPFTEETGWTFNQSFRARDHRAQIHLTCAERARGTAARAKYGRYVLIEPCSKHPNLRWPIDHWTALISCCPDLTFVQHVHSQTTDRVPGAHYEEATFREACGLLTGAAVYIRGESGMCHAAAALGVYQVTIWGSCMDWTVLGGYPRQFGVGVRMPPCGSWKSCDHCQRTMASIPVSDVRSALYWQLSVQEVAA